MRHLLLAALLLALAARSSSATAAPKPSGILRWGGDSAGGAPYVFQDPKDPSKTIGFEADVADLLAAELGMKAQFVQNQWDSLVPGLKRGDYDVVINGLEITDDRKAEVEFSDPYCIGPLRRRSPCARTPTTSELWPTSKGRKAGTARSKALSLERLLAATGGVEVIGYDTQTMLYDDLALGRFDAVLLDQPAAVYYGIGSSLKNLPGQYGRIAYGVAMRKGDVKLLAKVNAALAKLIKSGKLETGLHERWGIWNPVMAATFTDDNPKVHAEPADYAAYLASRGLHLGWRARLDTYLGYIPLLAKGAVTTIELSLLSMSIAIALGLLLALMRLYGPLPVSALATVCCRIHPRQPAPHPAHALSAHFLRPARYRHQAPAVHRGGPRLGDELRRLRSRGVPRRASQAIPHTRRWKRRSRWNMTRWQALRYIIIPQAHCAWSCRPRPTITSPLLKETPRSFSHESRWVEHHAASTASSLR